MVTTQLPSTQLINDYGESQSMVWQLGVLKINVFFFSYVKYVLYITQYGSAVYIRIAMGGHGPAIII